MCFIMITTISYLYTTSNISKNDYFKLLLSDTYGNNFYINLVEIINKNFNPLNIIQLDEVKSNSFNLSNNIYMSDPIVYIYNANQNYEYKEEYNINPSVIMTSFLLSNKLNESGVKSIFEENNINEFSKNNNMSHEDTLNLFINDKLNTYSSLKHIINIGRSDVRKSVIIINNKKYALISLYANEENITLLNKINTKLNEIYNGISKIYIDSEYNRFINIDFGGVNNSMKEVLNSVEVFSNIFKEVI